MSYRIAGIDVHKKMLAAPCSKTARVPPVPRQNYARARISWV
jgi:hypothetical protein